MPHVLDTARATELASLLSLKEHLKMGDVFLLRGNTLSPGVANVHSRAL